MLQQFTSRRHDHCPQIGTIKFSSSPRAARIPHIGDGGPNSGPLAALLSREILTFVSKSFLSSADNATNVKSTALSLRCSRGSAKLFSPVSQLLFSSLLPPNFAFTETVGFSHRLGGACSRAATSLCVTELFACTGALRFLLPFTREQSEDLTIAR